MIIGHTFQPVCQQKNSNFLQKKGSTFFVFPSKMPFLNLMTLDTHSFDFRPLGLAIREAREKAGLSRNDLGDKVFYGERHIADIENIGKHPSFQLFHDLVTMFNISVDEYFYPAKNVEKNTARRQIDSPLDLLSDNELKIIQGTIDGILNSRENKK